MIAIKLKTKLKSSLLAAALLTTTSLTSLAASLPGAKFDNGYLSGLTTTGSVAVNPGNLWNLPQSSKQLFISIIYQSTWTFPTSPLGISTQPLIGTTDAGGVNSFALEVLPPITSSGSPGSIVSTTPMLVLYLSNPGTGHTAAFAVPNMIRNDGTPHLLQVSLTTNSITNTFQLQASQDRSMYSSVPISPATLDPVTTPLGDGFNIPLTSSVNGKYHWWVGQNVTPVSQSAGSSYTYEPLVVSMHGSLAKIAPWVYTYKGLLSQIFVWPQTPVNLAQLIVNDTFQKPLTSPGVTEGTFVSLPSTGANVLFNGQVAPSVYLNSVGTTVDSVTGQVTNFLLNNGNVATGDPNFYTPTTTDDYEQIESITIDNTAP